VLEGELVKLRGLELSDVEILHEYFNDPEVRRYLDGWIPYSLQEEEEFIKNTWKQRKEGSNYVFGIVDKETGKLIGTIDIHAVSQKSRNGELGIAIGFKGYWGQGYGTDAVNTLLEWAFDQMNFHSIELWYNEFNERGKRCYEKCGFREVAKFKELHWSDGRYWDYIGMQILKKEWLKSPDQVEAKKL